MRGLLIAGILVWGLSCSLDGNLVSPTDESNFALYFLRSDTVTTGEAVNRPLEQLELKAAPWFDTRDIAFYDYSTHCIYLKGDKSALFSSFALGRFEPPLIDKPFVVAAGGKPCYLGCVRSGLLSTAPPTPYICELDVWYYPEDVLHISRQWIEGEDARSDPRVRAALIESGLYHAGLNLKLDYVRVLWNGDTSTVQYGFTLKNEDREPLHTIDPERTGSGLFHYYTNGVVFSSENHPCIWSQYKTITAPSPYDSWRPSSFTKIEAGQSIHRKVTLRGYPRIPKGVYTCHLTYSGPTKIERSQRNLADGRYWIGEIKSNSIGVAVN